jgi:thiol-disulfide isomerase/thioredoxin
MSKLHIMRFLSAGIFVFMGIFNAFSQKTTYFDVKITGYKPGDKFQLLAASADQTYLVDTAFVAADGVAHFKKAQGYPEGLYYMLLPESAYFQLLIANGENFTLKSEKSQLLEKMQTENSLENQLLNENLQFQQDLERRFTSLTESAKQNAPNSPQYEAIKRSQQKLLETRDEALLVLKEKYPKAFFTKYKLAGQNPKLRYAFTADGALDSTMTLYNFRADWWNDFDFSDGRLANTPVFFNKMKKYITELAPANPDSAFVYADFLVQKCFNEKTLFTSALSWVLFNFKPSSTKLMDGETVYARLIQKYYRPELVDWEKSEDLISMQNTAKSILPSSVGAIGQDIFGQNKKKETKRLYDLKTPFTVLFIYNPDCEHCQTEAPKLRKFYDEWRDKGVGIFSLAANVGDAEYQKWLRFQEKYGINWETDVIDPALLSRYHEKYFIDITPELYVLDRNHRVIGKNLKPEQLAEFLTAEMAKLK